MKLSILSLATLAMISCAPVEHEHMRKAVEYVTTTVTEIHGHPPAAAETPVAETPVAQSAPVVKSTSVLTSSSAKPSSSIASKSSTTKSTVGPSPTGDFDAGAKGIVYSPYNADQTCKSLAQVKADLAKFSGFSTIRLYGVDCNQVENVLQAKAPKQKLFLGIFFMNQITAGINQMADAIEKYGSWDDVETVSIGNELVNSGQANPAQIAQYVQTGRQALQSRGYTGPVVSVDTFVAVLNNPELCEMSDYVAVNAHAYFDKNTKAEDAGKWVLQQIERVSSTCGGKKTVITESGWPSQGNVYGLAVPTKQDQKLAIDSIKDVCGNDSFLFTGFNDMWKQDGPYGVEKYFGIFSQ